MDDLPAWVLMVSHIITGLGGGGLAAWLGSSGERKSALAKQVDADTRRMEAVWAQLDRTSALLEDERRERESQQRRFEKALEEEQARCDEKLARFERQLQETRQTVHMLVGRLEEHSDPILEEIDL